MTVRLSEPNGRDIAVSATAMTVVLGARAAIAVGGIRILTGRFGPRRLSWKQAGAVIWALSAVKGAMDAPDRDALKALSPQAVADRRVAAQRRKGVELETEAIRRAHASFSAAGAPEQRHRTWGPPPTDNPKGT